VDIYTALLGGQARVPTLAGDVMLSIPPESQNGRLFRIAGRGMPKLRDAEAHGDMYAHLSLRIPTALSEREQQLIAELRALRPGQA
jgi:curved DNA-binding protein